MLNMFEIATNSENNFLCLWWLGYNLDDQEFSVLLPVVVIRFPFSKQRKVYKVHTATYLKDNDCNDYS